jgi:hypothetical protein
MGNPTLTTTDGKTYNVQLTDQKFANLLCNYRVSSIKIPTEVGDVDVVLDTILGIKFANDGTLIHIGDWFLNNCDSFNQQLILPDSLTTIGSFFLSSGIFRLCCILFNQPIILPDSLTSIGDYFLSSCTSFNRPLRLPDSLTSIGDYFLSSCTSFNRELVLPNSLTSVGGGFLYCCDAMTSLVNIGNLAATVFSSEKDDELSMYSENGALSTYSDTAPTLSTYSDTAPARTTGITIAGTNVDAFLKRFPNMIPFLSFQRHYRCLLKSKTKTKV